MAFPKLQELVGQQPPRGINVHAENDLSFQTWLPSSSATTSPDLPTGENGGAIFDHGSGGIVLLRAA